MPAAQRPFVSQVGVGSGEQGAESRPRPGRARSMAEPLTRIRPAPPRSWVGICVVCSVLPLTHWTLRPPGDLALHVGCFLKPFQTLPSMKRKQHFRLTPFTARNTPRHFQSGSYRITGGRSSAVDFLGSPDPVAVKFFPEHSLFFLLPLDCDYLRGG